MPNPADRYSPKQGPIRWVVGLIALAGCAPAPTRAEPATEHPATTTSTRLAGVSSDRRVATIGSWSIIIPSGLQVVQNQDSWQARDEHRIVYISSLIVRDRDGAPTPARELAASTLKLLAGADAPILRHEAPNLAGAAVTETASNMGWQLKGSMATDGSSATCLIDYDSPDLRDWAVATWRSLESSK